MDQEEAVRRKLVALGYIQPHGSSDEEIRLSLGIVGKCADFVAFHPDFNRWLVGESKGSNVDVAYIQLRNTVRGLLAKEPQAAGKIDLRVYLDASNYSLLTESEGGLGGHRLRDGLLGYFDEQEVWHYIEIDGGRIEVVREPAT